MGKIQTKARIKIEIDLEVEVDGPMNYQEFQGKCYQALKEQIDEEGYPDLENTNVTFKTETKEWAKIQRTE